jgi:hypothetical protein
LWTNLIADRGYLEIPTLLVVENGGKHTGGIESRETEPIDRAVQPHQCSGTHVADDSMVFYGLIRHVRLPLFARAFEKFKVQSSMFKVERVKR